VKRFSAVVAKYAGGTGLATRDTVCNGAATHAGLSLDNGTLWRGAAFYRGSCFHASSNITASGSITYENDITNVHACDYLRW